MFLTFYSIVLLNAIFGRVNGGNQEDDQVVVVKLNPFVAKSKKLIQFRGDGRFKRGENSQEKSALFLEFPESFFSDSKLKSLYSSLIGGSRVEKRASTESTKIVFQIDPSGLDEEKDKDAQNRRRKHIHKEKRDLQKYLDNPLAYQKTMLPANIRLSARNNMGLLYDSTKAKGVEGITESTSPNPIGNGSIEKENVGVPSAPKCNPTKPMTPKSFGHGGTPEGQTTETSMEELTMYKGTAFTPTTCQNTQTCKQRSPFLPYVQKSQKQPSNETAARHDTAFSRAFNEQGMSVSEAPNQRLWSSLSKARSIYRSGKLSAVASFTTYRDSGHVGSPQRGRSEGNQHSGSRLPHSFPYIGQGGPPGMALGGGAGHRCPGTCPPRGPYWPIKGNEYRPPCPSCQRVPSMAKCRGNPCPTCVPTICAPCGPGCPVPCPTCCVRPVWVRYDPIFPLPCPTICHPLEGENTTGKLSLEDSPRRAAVRPTLRNNGPLATTFHSFRNTMLQQKRYPASVIK